MRGDPILHAWRELEENIQQLEEENENLRSDLEAAENTQWNSLTLEEREKIIKEFCK